MKTPEILLAGLLVGWSCTGLSSTILDQWQADDSSSENVYGNVSVAQTFTPSVSGNLAELDLFLSNHNTGEGLPLLISIYTTLGGVPNSSLGTFNLNNVPQNWTWHYLDFSGLGISLSANTQYAVVLSCPGTFYGIAARGSINLNNYLGGRALIQADVGTPWFPDNRAPQLDFYTYMTVPEPSSCVLVLLACGLFGVRKIALRRIARGLDPCWFNVHSEPLCLSANRAKPTTARIAEDGSGTTE
jgi:hypothetical protein